MNCIIKAHHAGLFSLINNVIACTITHQHVHVDWSNGTFYSPQGVNLWNELFEPTQNLDASKVLCGYEEEWMTGRNADALYLAENFGALRTLMNVAWRQYKTHIQPIPIPEPYVSVLIRTGDIAGEQHRGQRQSFEEYEQAIRSAMTSENQPLFIACSDRETLAWFAERFPQCTWNPASSKSETRATEIHLTTPQTIDDAKLCLVDVLTMAAAEHFVHSVSNMATGALYINPSLKNTYVR